MVTASLLGMDLIDHLSNLLQPFPLPGLASAVTAGIIIGIMTACVEVHAYCRKHRRIDPSCGFCSSANGKPITRVVRRWRWRGVVALETLNPVTPGHVVVVSRWHSRNAGDNPRLAARVMRCAAELVSELGAANVIVSKGPEATQSFDHTHFHVVPRRWGDNLPMPWTGQVIESQDVTS